MRTFTPLFPPPIERFRATVAALLLAIALIWAGSLKAAQVGESTARGEERDIDAREVCRSDVLDDDLLAAERELLTCGAGGCEEAHPVRLRAPFLEKGTHDVTNLPGCSDYCECDAHRPVPP